MKIPFLKMNGLGNDFIIIDARKQRSLPAGDLILDINDLGPDRIQKIADRKLGIGCDQLILMNDADDADASIRIWNADGGEAGACGNATRCVGWLLLQEGKSLVRLRTPSGLAVIELAKDKNVRVDMGKPGLDWREIPLSEPMDTRGIELQIGPIDRPFFHTPGCVSMGNPHVIFFTSDISKAPVTDIGPILEYHPLFPERANIGFAEVVSKNLIRYRVWERGVGETKACGTGACAALVAAHRRGLSARSAVVSMTGGDLEIDWCSNDDHVLMTGPVSLDDQGFWED